MGTGNLLGAAIAAVIVGAALAVWRAYPLARWVLAVAALLADTDVDTAIVWVDRVLHRVIPIVLMADWLIDPPAVRIDLRRAWWWLSYPLAWVVYTMIRGAMVGTYPYPFLDPANGGYGAVLGYCVAILVGMLLFIYAIVWIGNAMAVRRPSAA